MTRPYQPLPYGFRMADVEVCPTCDGCGESQVEDSDDCTVFWRKVDCGGCGGSGFYPPCHACLGAHGAKYIDDDERGWCQACLDEAAFCWVCGAAAVDATGRFCGAACEAEWLVTQAESKVER